MVWVTPVDESPQGDPGPLTLIRKLGAAPAMQATSRHHSLDGHLGRNGGAVLAAASGEIRRILRTAAKKEFASSRTRPPCSGTAPAASTTSRGCTTPTTTSQATANGLNVRTARPAHEQEHIHEIHVFPPTANQVPAAGRYHDQTMNKMLKTFQTHPKQHRHNHSHNKHQQADHNKKMNIVPLAVPTVRATIPDILLTTSAGYGEMTEKTLENATATDNDHHENEHHDQYKYNKALKWTLVTNLIGLVGTWVTHAAPYAQHTKAWYDVHYASFISDGGMLPRPRWNVYSALRAFPPPRWPRYPASWTLAGSAACGHGHHHTPQLPRD